MNIFRFCRINNLLGISSCFNASRCNSSTIRKSQGGIITFMPLKTLFANNTSYRFSRGFLSNSCRFLQSRTFLRNLCADSGKETEKGLGKNQDSDQKKISRTEQLKIAVRDYGSTVIVFHVGISLMSLGICYVLISNGLDAAFVLKAVGFSESVISSKVAVGGSTFVMAYAVHKLFAPLRIVITLSAAPFIVRYFRRIGILKLPKS